MVCYTNAIPNFGSLFDHRDHNKDLNLTSRYIEVQSPLFYLTTDDYRPPKSDPPHQQLATHSHSHCVTERELWARCGLGCG
jgi:hypothetical protein